MRPRCNSRCRSRNRSWKTSCSISVSAAAAPAGRSPESAPLKDFGGKLYGAVFQDELRDELQRSLTLTRSQQARMRLRLADTAELAELPWEFLDPRRDRFLAQSRRVGHTEDS